jgi:hypothetical protein
MVLCSLRNSEKRTCALMEDFIKGYFYLFKGGVAMPFLIALHVSIAVRM